MTHGTLQKSTSHAGFARVCILSRAFLKEFCARQDLDFRATLTNQSGKLKYPTTLRIDLQP